MTELRSKTEQPIQVRFVGDGLVPDSVRPHEIADMLWAIEDLIVASVQAERPDLEKDAIVLGLQTLEAKSIGLGFRASPEPVVVPVFRLIAQIISTQSYSRLAHGAREAVKKIAGFTRKYRCVAELRVRQGGATEVLATIGPNVDIPPAPRVTGITTVYGRVLDVGGTAPPNVHLELQDGTRVTCRGTTTQIKALASYLYTTVGVEGNARWDSDSLEILDFEIINFTSQEYVPLDDAISDLRRTAGPHFGGVDALQYVHELREDHGEA